MHVIGENIGPEDEDSGQEPEFPVSIFNLKICNLPNPENPFPFILHPSTARSRSSTNAMSSGSGALKSSVSLVFGWWKPSV